MIYFVDFSIEYIIYLFLSFNTIYFSNEVSQQILLFKMIKIYNVNFP